MKDYTILLCENEHFKFELLKRDYGTNVYLTNKTEEYSIYDIFDSFSWFNEYVSKLFNATEILNLGYLNVNNYETAKEIVDREYVRIKNFFNYITTDIKYIIEQGEEINK